MQYDTSKRVNVLPAQQIDDAAIASAIPEFTRMFARLAGKRIDLAGLMTLAGGSGDNAIKRARYHLNREAHRTGYGVYEYPDHTFTVYSPGDNPPPGVSSTPLTFTR